MKKGCFLSFFLVLFFLCFGLSQANAWNPNGKWVNLDLESGGTHSLEIQLPYIHGFGQCTPNPCDWGTTTAYNFVATHDKNNSDKQELMAVWCFGFKCTVAFISPHPENPDYLVLKTYDWYSIMGDSRTDRYTIEYLKRE